MCGKPDHIVKVENGKQFCYYEGWCSGYTDIWDCGCHYNDDLDTYTECDCELDESTSDG